MKKKTRNPKRQGVMVVKYDWSFRWLRNQAVQFFARQDHELRRSLKAALKPARTYTDVELVMRDHVVKNGDGKGKTWHQFMDHLFGSKINKRMRA